MNNAPLVDRLGVTAISKSLYVDVWRVDLKLPEISESTRLDSWCLTTRVPFNNLMHDTFIRFICQLGIYKTAISSQSHSHYQCTFAIALETVIYTTFLNEGYTETGSS